MIHSISIEIKNLVGSFSRESEPIIQVDSGDEIHAQTRCCWWGIGKPSRPEDMPEVIEPAARKDPENDTGMPLVGPIGVKGAKPGMTLEVEILELKVGDYGRSVTGGSPKERYEWLALDDT
ncbi:MAG TPA: acetamidase, partial [Armatimonadota bacterium]